MASPPQSSISFPDDPFAPSSGHISGDLRNDDTVGGESLSKWAKATRFTVLNHFSQVTNVARNGAHTLLTSPLFQQQPGKEDKSMESNLGRASAASLGTSLLQHGPVGPFGPNDPGWKHSDLAQRSGTGDFDSAHVYLARWAKIVAEEGERNRKKEQDARQQKQESLQKPVIEDSDVGSFEIWSSAPWAERPTSTRQPDNPLALQDWRAFFDHTGKPTIRFPDVKKHIFERGFGKGKERERSDGAFWDQMDPRAEAWSFLLGAQPWAQDKNFVDRRHQWAEKAEEYWMAKRSWLRYLENEVHLPSVQDSKFWKEQRHRIGVDCLRVDKRLSLFAERGVADKHGNGNEHSRRLEHILACYVLWDQLQEAHGSGETDRGLLGGYVQGMSDLCAPLYELCDGDEPKTFWLFVGLMQRARHNFYSDQSGMKMQLLNLQKLITVLDPGLHAHLERTDSLNLFFCFRWLLVYFKREFEYPDILCLWEAILAADLDKSLENDTTIISRSSTSLSDHFQVFVAFAVLQQHREMIIKYLQHFDEILQYMNGLSGQISVDAVLAEAQTQCLLLRTLIEQQSNDDTVESSLRTSVLPHVDAELRILVGEAP